MAPGPGLNRRRRALLSVTDKTRLGELARALHGRGYELVASGGTAAALRLEGLDVREVGELTGFPEIFDGRIKTLHPLVFGGILGPDEAALAQAAGLGVLPFDVVVVNLYEFAATAGSGADEAAVIEKIDVGGPSLLRAAAKNHARVCVLPDPAFYDDFLEALAGADGFPDHEFRRNMAAAAFAVTADYDAAIADWFAGGHACCDDPDHDHDHDHGHEHEQILGIELRYGENPHQKAELMLPGEDADDPLAGMGLRQLSGKELSFNNLVDVIAAVKLVDDLEVGDGVACAAIKHTNPCGVGLGATAAAALARALHCDPDAAFGGVFVFTCEVDAAAAADLHARFCEVIVAPSFSAEAQELLGRKKNLRLLTLEREAFRAATWGQVSIFGDVQLHQDEDEGFPELETWRHVAGPAPDAATAGALDLLWRICKHVKSNAVLLGDATGTLGVGAGQMSRVDSARLAVRKAADRNLDLTGCACASDAFFPFPDGIELLHAAGVRAVVAPSGSIRDAEVIAAADRLGVTLMHTDRRHFRH